MRNLVRAMATASLLVAAPVAAQDVKAGVDAWGRGDYKAAVEQWRGPAIAGDADAQFNLGQAYKLGRGVPLDPALAESWFRKAAMQGHYQAEDNYGLALFTDGKKTEALPWLEKSVARGEPRAELVLGTMLFNGDGVTRDFPRAYALMTRASQAGLKSASETLAQMDQYISPEDRQKGIALAQQLAAQQKAMPQGPGAVRRTGVPPSRAGMLVSDAPAAPRPEKLPPTSGPAVVAKSSIAPSTPEPAKPAPAAREPRPARTEGAWRIQLGAFSSQANAEKQWSRLRGRLGGAKPFYEKAGRIVRLQAGGYASKAEADRACSISKVSCLVVAP